MIDRVVTFLVLGFFIFAPQIQSFWSIDPVRWYGNYLVWLALIGLCWIAARHKARARK